VACQQNHSFDHYFGSYAGLPAGFGTPPDFTNSGVAPFHFPNLTGNGSDPNHGWPATHQAYANGQMSGFVSNGSGRNAMGYYTGADLGYYSSLLPRYTLCANYFRGMLTSTFPNRMVLYAGTSGGWTANNVPFNSLTWPNITTLLASHNVTYKNYNFNCPNNYSTLALWKNNYNAPNMNETSTAFYADCANGALPQVAFLTDAPPYDEHPPANVHIGQTLIQQIISAVEASPQWGSTALLFTYDEHGGFFDHRPPTQLDGFGDGIRVPMIVISPLARQGYVDTTYSDHASVLKFLEHVFGLPTLASINHQFDTSTPSVGQGGGAPFPPRDGNAAISDLTRCFNVPV
jgi:phospholipase C